MIEKQEGSRDTIVYIGAFELPDKNAAAQRVLANAKIFESIGYRIVLIGRTYDPDVLPNRVKRKEYDGIALECWEIGAPRSAKDWFYYIFSTKQVEAAISEKIGSRLHSIICYNFPAVSQFRLKRFANRLGGLGLADVTEWYQQLEMRNIAAVIKNIDGSLRMRLVNFRMDGLITTSRFLTRYYEQKVFIVAELPTLIDYFPANDVKLVASPEGEAKKLFYAGSVIDKRSKGQEKGGLKDRLDWVLELLGMVYDNGIDFHLDIYGVTRQEYLRCFAEHEKLVKKLDKVVAFHGRQPRVVILQATVNSDFSIFMRPFIRTTIAGFPTKFSESVTYGTPVITNKLDCLVPYIQEGKNCFIIDYRNKKEAVSKLSHILTLSQSEVLQMKVHCLRSGQFQFQQYTNRVRKNFPRLGKE